MSESEEVIARGKLFEIVQTKQPDGRVFEVARRAPGARIIIWDKETGTILLTKEFRKELDDWDYRLPGGKVFDSLAEYETHRLSEGDIVEAAQTQAIVEARQEAGIDIGSLQLYKKSVLGATVEWDLYVFETSDWQKNIDGQDLEDGEEIEADVWVGFDEAKHMILAGKMQEERIALVLLRWMERSVRSLT
ncbi:MAG: hydrolase [Candidatus Saccharibacteria bacterium]|nr:hydrolase [Candidatus Saccharibacteria bacterium]